MSNKTHVNITSCTRKDLVTFKLDIPTKHGGIHVLLDGTLPWEATDEILFPGAPLV